MMAVVANTRRGARPADRRRAGRVRRLAVERRWHWIFLINVPIGILGIALALRVLPETPDPHAGTDGRLAGNG